MEENENKEITCVNSENTCRHGCLPTIKFLIKTLLAALVIAVSGYFMVGMLIGLGLGGGPHGWSGNENNWVGYFVGVGIPFIIILLLLGWWFVSLLKWISSFFHSKQESKPTVNKINYERLFYLFLVILSLLFYLVVWLNFSR